MALISIIIANYNNGHFFKDCYKSLISQTEKNWEAIIIDDSSTDNSIEVIESLIKKDDRFKFYKNEKNLGYQKSLIKAIELSTAEIFGRLDPDDMLTPDALMISLETHYKNPKVGLVYSNFYRCNELLEIQTTDIRKQIFDRNIFLQGQISHFATFKKTFYNKTTGIDPFILRAEDQDIYMKMCEIAPVKHIPKPLYYYRIHNGGISTNTNIEKAKFWNWVAIIKAAERRNVNIEDLFVENFIQKKEFEKISKKIELLKKSQLLKFLYKIGLFKAYKYL